MRLRYIDALRGLAIFCVVFLHFIGFGMKLNSVYQIQIIIQKFFIPLFFFVSGFLGYKTRISFGEFIALSKKKVHTLLVPTVVFFMLSSWHFSFNPWTAWCYGGAKGGYWFTWVLFQQYLVYYLIKMLINSAKNSHLYNVLFCVLFVAVFILSYYLQHSMCGMFLSLDRSVYGGYLFFVLGLFCKRYQGVFLQIQDNGFYIWLLVIVIVIDSCVLHLHWAISGSAFVFLIFSSFYYNRVRFEKSSRFFRLFPFLGANSIVIYFIHFWLLFNIPECVNIYLNNNENILCYAGHGALSFLLFLIVSPIVICISLCCIGIKYAIDFIPYANTLLFGDIKSTQQNM